MDFNAIAEKLRQIDEAPVPAIPGAPGEMPEPKPSISVNMNAQGADSIQDLLRILANIDDSEESDTKLDVDMDGDHQPDLAVLDDPEDAFQDEAYANEPDPEHGTVDDLLNKYAGGMNRPKSTHSKVGGGDNPLQKISAGESDLKAQIRAELMQRLQETKEK